ncbi:MAG: 23S rRNA (guanosine(2251)-2'-O)-methyltransferase RlmB [Alphaproteobacteria bacterium]|nr:MAG: 23S rRNA (guanosine(2251)-2'-O)-methyltransferase RlmB [Alphaproteobacteria bacterium]
MKKTTTRTKKTKTNRATTRPSVDSSGERENHSRSPVSSYWLYGRHAVAAAWANPARLCLRLVGSEEALRDFTQGAKRGKDVSVSRPVPQTMQRADLDRLLPPGSVHQGLAVQVKPLEIDTDEDAPEGARLILVLDQITDPHNVGAILRSAAAFGVDVVMMTAHHMPHETGVMAKTACGAMDIVRLQRVVNLARTLDKLRDQGYYCVGLSEHAEKNLGQMDLSGQKIALVLGAEGQGLRRLTMERCDALARLPTGGALGSLNVSNAAAIALYEVARQRVVPA